MNDKLKMMLHAHKLLEETRPNEDSEDFEIWKDLMESSWKLILEEKKIQEIEE